MATDDLGNVCVDFVWGNQPMQPNDERLDDDESTPELDPDLDSHIIATSQYNGFPDYTPAAPYLDTIENVEVPDVVGETVGDAETAIEDEDFVYAAAAGTYVGATTVNDGKVKSQSPAAGSMANLGSTVTVTPYAAPVVPNLVGMTESQAEAALVAVHLVKGTVTTDASGANGGNDGTVKSQGTTAGNKANTGAAVAFVLYDAP